MRYQSNRASCGPASLHNALAALGIKRSEDELIALSGQTPNGTSSRGIIKAIKSVSTPEAELFGTAVRWRNIQEGSVGLWYLVGERGRPVILCVDDFEHWVSCVGYLGGRFMIVDSAHNGLLLYYDKEQLNQRWEGPRGGYHGIIV